MGAIRLLFSLYSLSSQSTRSFVGIFREFIKKKKKECFALVAHSVGNFIGDRYELLIRSDYTIASCKTRIEPGFVNTVRVLDNAKQPTGFD